MDIRLTNQSARDIACDALVVGALNKKVAQQAKSVELLKTTHEVDNLLNGLISQICADGEFKAQPRE